MTENIDDGVNTLTVTNNNSNFEVIYPFKMKFSENSEIAKFLKKDIENKLGVKN